MFNIGVVKAKAKHIDTPVGKFPFPMNRRFKDKLEAYRTNIDLFMQVEENRFINPDAFTELYSRGLVNEYKKWKK